MLSHNVWQLRTLHGSQMDFDLDRGSTAIHGPAFNTLYYGVAYEFTEAYSS